jgi:hypothetical protein
MIDDGDCGAIGGMKFGRENRSTNPTLPDQGCHGGKPVTNCLSYGAALGCWLGLLHKIFTFLSVLVSGLCVLYHNFYCIFSFCVRCLYSCSYNDIGCSVIEVSSF